MQKRNMIPTQEEKEDSPKDDGDFSYANDNINEVSCGIGNFKPRWLQRFASAKVYLVLFCSIGILQGAYFTYFIGILSTLEKRYAFESQVTGIILIADNLSPALCGICLGYYGKLAHRPRLVTAGMMIVVFSCFVSCLPYIVYGSAMHNLEELRVSEGTVQDLCLNSTKSANCEPTKAHSTMYAVPILFLANFLNGFGSMAYYTVGTPYMDDNVKKKESPLYLGFTFALRVVGPTFGFMLSSFCLQYYENPFADPGFPNDDPRWIGAWWMGFPILGAALFIFSIPIVLFPRSLESTLDSDQSNLQCRNETIQRKGLIASLKRLFRNPILVLHTVSITFQINGIFGYYVFMPKYMESQYQKTASSASFFSGTISLLTTVGGIFLGGIFIRRFKPRPRFLTGYMVFVEIFAGLGLIAALFLGCSSIKMPSNDVVGKDILSDCNQECECSETAYSPVCDLNGTVYFSPCFGGCSAYNITGKVFHNCGCVALQNHSVYTSTSDSLSAAFCSENCQTFLAYFIVLSLSKIFASTVRVANVLVTLRCVDDDDKTLALGAVEFVISFFATIPYPLIYGHVIDTACLVWEESCGRRGNCWIYDREKFRHYFHGLSLAFICVGLICDIGVFYYSKRLTNFYGTETRTKNNATQLEKETDEVHPLRDSHNNEPPSRSVT